MLRLVGLGIGVAWVWVGWRNMPPMSDGSAGAVGLAIGVTCWVSYLCGRSLNGARATAIANARAEARATATSTSQAAAVGNVFVIGGQASPVGARQAGADLTGLDGAEWIVGPRPQIEQDVMEQIAEDIEGVREYEAG